MMPAAGAEARAEQLATLARGAPPAVRLRRGREPDRRRAARGRGLDPDAEPRRADPRRRPRLGEGAPGPGRAARRAGARGGARRGGVASRRARSPTSSSCGRSWSATSSCARRFAACYEGFEDFEHPYDPLLDEYEPGMPTERDARACSASFATGSRRWSRRSTDARRRGRRLVPARRVPRGRAARAGRASWSPSCRSSRRSWRLDPTAHPFATAIAPRDVRLTTRYDEDYLPTALFGALHEAGHGLYDAGVDPELARSPLGRPRSLGLHESQSRLWENWVGRGRPYLERAPAAAAQRVPGPVRRRRRRRAPPRGQPGASLADPRRGRRADLQPPHPDPLRARAGALRGRARGRRPARGLERALRATTSGSRSPTTPTACSRTSTGPAASFGYFPTYSLGNVIAGQLWEAARRDLGDLDGARSAAASSRRSASGCASNVHRHGRRLDTQEVVERATGAPIESPPYIRHLEAKYSAIYGARAGGGVAAAASGQLDELLDRALDAAPQAVEAGQRVRVGAERDMHRAGERDRRRPERVAVGGLGDRVQVADAAPST